MVCFGFTKIACITFNKIKSIFFIKVGKFIITNIIGSPIRLGVFLSPKLEKIWYKINPHYRKNVNEKIIKNIIE